LVGLVVYLAIVGLDKADKLGSAIGMLLAAVGLLAPYLLPPSTRSVPNPEDRTASGLESAKFDLRDAKGVQIVQDDGVGTQSNTFNEA
jgi:hypothetical protein